MTYASPHVLLTTGCLSVIHSRMAEWSFIIYYTTKYMTHVTVILLHQVCIANKVKFGRGVSNIVSCVCHPKTMLSYLKFSKTCVFLSIIIHRILNIHDLCSQTVLIIMRHMTSKYGEVVQKSNLA